MQQEASKKVQRPKSRVKNSAARTGGNPSQQQYSRPVKSKTTTKTKDLRENILKQNKTNEKQEIVKEPKKKEVLIVIEGNTEDTNTEGVRINLKHQCSSVVETVASTLGMCIMKDYSENWDIYWSDYSLLPLKPKCTNMFQRINHFPGMENLEFKALLAKHLNRMRTEFQDDYNFFPKSWRLPYEYLSCISYLEQNPKEVYILKPSRGAGGKGIKIFSDVKELKQYRDNNMDHSCQMYISDTMLLDGYKFDLRLYVLIASVDPLKIFVYNNGLIRLATCPYHPPNEDNMSNNFMHLTNYSINKSSKDYDTTAKGSKRDFVAFSKWMRAKKLDENKLWRDIDDVIIKTVISIHPILAIEYVDLFYLHWKNYTEACFEVLGFYIILDRTMKPFLLDVNRSPSLKITGFVDDKVKRNLIFDTFKLLNLHTKPVKRDPLNEVYELGNYREIFSPNQWPLEYSKFICFIHKTFRRSVDDLRRKKM